VRLREGLHGIAGMEGEQGDDDDEDASGGISIDTSKRVAQHIVFVDSKKEGFGLACLQLWNAWLTFRAAASKFDVVKHFDTVPELAGRAFNRPRVSTLESTQIFGKTDAATFKVRGNAG
jgi:hypothetical protein